MNEKRSAIFTIAVISSIILVFTIADLIQGDRLFSETENRVLASRPEFTVKALLGGTYTKDYETYATDQFVSRDKWIAIKTYTDLALGKREISGVYLGKDGYLIESHLPEKYPDGLVEERLALLSALVERWEAKVMLVPTADNVLRDKLPAHAPCFDQGMLLEKAAGQMGEERFIDVYAALREHAGEEIYYRTDHHWTSLGAYYGYLAWLEDQEGEEFSQALYSPADLETVTEEFLGTLHSKVNIDVAPDAIQYFPATAEKPVKVTYDLRIVKDGCYEESYLDTKNKYGFFLDDNHAVVEIETDCRNGKTLFLIKDSYANCFVPLLIPYYERIYMMDLRYFKGRLFRFMEGYEPENGMDVLVLYNCIHFLEDFKYLE